MHTDCTSTHLAFEGLGRRAVVGRFDGGRLTTDGGVLLLREVDRRFRVTSRLAACFRDHPRRIEHRLETLVVQRVLALAAGYEDLNDHDRLRADSAFALASGCADVTGERRRRARDRGHALARIVPQIRRRWPGTRIRVRGDAGFCREGILRWCEDAGLEYVFGLARNARLEPWLAKALHKSRRRGGATGRAARRFRECRYRTLASWSRARRVIGKAEWLPGLRGANPRFVVTNIPRRTLGAQALYEDLYCARGDMENRIKEQQLWRFADRTSSATMRANQLRLTFSAFAGALLTLLRQVGLQGTALARARADTIRARLLKVAARITVTVRRIRVAFPSVYPLQELFAHVLAALRAPPVRAGPA